jgi:hypothetical protein
VLPGAPNRGDVLSVVGTFAFVAAPPGGEANTEWALRLRSGGECVLLNAGAGCFKHDCQTLEGFSGSPLYAVAKQSGLTVVKFAGLQVGGPASNCPLLDPRASSFNTAASVSGIAARLTSVAALPSLSPLDMTFVQEDSHAP